MKTPHVLVIGSINMDLVCYSDRIPHVGETVMGSRFTTVPGGKGANQAMAASRLGAQVSFIGAVGKDSYGREMLQYFQNNRLQTTYIKEVDDSTGVALINVDAAGNNQIVVVPGANYRLGPADLEAAQEAFAGCDVVVLQLEVPLETVGKAIELGKRFGKPVILNPAPVQSLPEEWLSQVDYLVPNEHEALLLGGEPEDGFEKLFHKINGTLIVTLGDKGLLFIDEEGSRSQSAFEVKPVDTTAAGDAFVGGFSVALAEGRPISEALRFASATAALSVTHSGAQTSLPHRNEVLEFLEEHT
ncbi:ribokinase [Heliobacillus mobilis]|uniref:Ribokinase n=1 Tax=Heliobacterium mobile TaxID=28064 RepID=A0A6I3SIZ5_HELMO|nr:ribokinase [Heliobacterium mobile]MTV48755.1 ribokinase [Heliobacterium mobile]